MVDAAESGPAELGEQIEALVGPEVALCGFDLVDLELLRGGGRVTMRFALAREDGDPVSVADCAKASRAIGRVLDADAEKLLPGQYVVEVSSPGMFRPLRRLRHFEGAAGQIAKLIVEKEPGGATVQLRGTLGTPNGSNIVLTDEAGKEHSFGFDQVRKAHLDPDLDFGKSKKKE